MKVYPKCLACNDNGVVEDVTRDSVIDCPVCSEWPEPNTYKRWGNPDDYDEMVDNAMCR